MTSTLIPAFPLEAFGPLTPVSRAGGQGRVHRPEQSPPELGSEPLVVKLYRRAPPRDGARVLASMVNWERRLPDGQRARLRELSAWPVAVIRAGDRAAGIVMRDVSPRYLVPFTMPSGRRDRVLLSLEHLLGSDAFLERRGLGVRLDTATRAHVAQRISAALAFLHMHGIAVGDLAPSNVLVSFAEPEVAACFIDCDSMVFRGSRALASVETGDWNLPFAFGELPGTRAADAYKFGLVVLRLLARSHDARTAAPHLRHIPVELRDLLHRALSADAASRPPAGEWQRALGALATAAGALNAAHPGPASLPAAAPRAPRAARPVHGPHAARPAPPSGRPTVQSRHGRPGKMRAGLPAPPSLALSTRSRALASQSRALASHSRALASRSRAARAAPGMQFAVAVLWVAALAVVAMMLLSRLGSPASGSPVNGYYYPQGRAGQVYVVPVPRGQ